MKRTQIQLPEEMARRLQEEAESRHVSMARLVREAVTDYLAAEPPDRREDRWDRAAAVAGRFASGRSDLADRHDDHFAEAAGG